MPEAVLLADVEGVGARGEVVDVSKGYLRNFLLPRKLAQPATKGAIEASKQAEASRERSQARAKQQAADTAELLSKTVLTLTEKAGEDGRLFGSVTNQDVATAIKEARGLDFDKRHIALEDPIRSVGTHMVDVEVAPGVHSTVKVIVSAA